MRVNFKEFVFDDYDAWDQTIKDPRWNINLPFTQFNSIYQEYRNKRQEKE